MLVGICLIERFRIFIEGGRGGYFYWRIIIRRREVIGKREVKIIWGVVVKRVEGIRRI